MITFLKAHYKAIIVIAIILAGGGYFLFGPKKQVPVELVQASRRPVASVVTVTGRVKPAETIELKFETSGKIARLNVDAGSQVTTGQVLGELDGADLRASLAQAQASIAIQQANLAELKRGTRPEELAIEVAKEVNAEKSVEDAKTDLANTQAKGEVDLANLYITIPDTLNTAYLNAHDAVTKQVDPFFIGIPSQNPRLSYVTSDTQAQIDSENERLRMNTVLTAFQSEIMSLGSSTQSRDTALANATTHLNAVRHFLDRLTATVNVSTSLSTSNIAAYKGYLTTATTNVNASLTALSAARQGISAQRAVNQSALSSAQVRVNDAERALIIARAQVQLKKAGPTQEQINSAEAQVRQSQANASVAAANLAKTVLRSPINGVITKRSVNAGEIVASSTAAFSMNSVSSLEIEANIPEVDIGKISLGNPVLLTLDAYPGQPFEAKIAYIDPAETIIDGVVNFRVKVSFATDDERLKSGLTANLTIETSRKENALALPQYAIVENDQGTFVRKEKSDKTTEDVPVTLGIRTADGYVEILSGVVENESVVNIGARTK